MSTRSLTVIRDREEEIVVMYRQSDGYPEGHGLELANFLEGRYIVNGINLKDKRKIANGMSCLAAQIICNFKKEPGGIYLHPSGSRNMGEAYIYTVFLDELNVLNMSVSTSNISNILFTGEPKAFIDKFREDE